MELFIGIMAVGVGAVAIVYALSPLFAWMKAGDALRHVTSLRLELHQLRTQVAGHEGWLGHLEGRLASVREAAPAPPRPTGQLALPFPAPEGPLVEGPPVMAPMPPPHWNDPPPSEVVPEASAIESAPTGTAAAKPTEPVPPTEPAPPTAPGERAGGWEQWLGVRGAAGLGAALLVLAGLYFFRYSIDNGWLTAPRRIALGLTFAIGCVVAGERWLRARHALLANCVVGAGVALLYLTSWAATDLYALWSSWTSAAVMVATTALCCVLAVARSSRAIAAFGMVGGFATPALLSTGHDRPLVLFAYLLLLDVGLLTVARHRRWSRVTVFSIVGTTAYQAFWVTTQMDASEVSLGMLIGVAFATLFAAGTMGRRDDDETLRRARAAAVLLPFGLTLVTSVSMAAPLPLLGAYLGALVVGSSLVAHRDRAPWLGVAATTAALGSLGARTLVPGTLAAEPVTIAAIVVAIGAALHGVAAWGLRRTDPAHPTVAPVVWATGATAVLGVACAGLSSPEALPAPFVAVSLLTASTVRLGQVARRPRAHVIAGVAFGAAVALALPSQLAVAGGAGVWIALAAALGAAFVFTRRLRGPHAGHGLAAASLLPLGALLVEAVPPTTLAAVLLVGTALAIGAARRHRAPGWLVATGLTVSVIAVVTTTGTTLPLAVVGATTVALLVTAVHLASATPSMWLAAGAVPVVAAPAVVALLDRTAQVPVALGPLALASLAAIATAVAPRDHRDQRGPFSWLAAVTLALGTSAVFLHFRGIDLAVAACVEALALIALWRHRDHAGLVWSAAGMLAFAVLRVLEPAVLLETPRGPWLLANRFALAYAFPAVALLLAAMAIRPFADARRRPWEPRTRTGRALLPQLLGGAAVTLGFLWVNVAIVDIFATGPTLAFDWTHQPARDLCLSLAWAVYALLLLVGGSRARKVRLAGLGLLLATSAKVFLYDLSHLDGLHRVLSLAGLAASLLLVSMSYQRLLRRGQTEPPS